MAADNPERSCAQRDAWGQLFVEHRAPVLATCMAMLRHRQQAEDAAQEVFARVPPDSSAIADARRWLLEVARNVCIDLLRHRQRRPAVALDASVAVAHRCDVERTVTDRMFLAWALAQLPARERLVLTRQMILDEPLDTVAQRVGVSYAVAAKLASRARRHTAAVADLHQDAEETSCAVA